MLNGECNNMYWELNNGLKIPNIIMGTYPLKDREMDVAIEAAIKSGYRAFDTAHAYGNESSLGNSLQKIYSSKKVKRSDVFIISKIGELFDNGIPNGKLFYSNNNMNKDIAKIVEMQLDKILENLKSDYLDLLLLHWPFPNFLLDIWEAIENEYLKGRVKSIGVSNCRERHIQKIIDNGRIVPMVNQIECHPLYTRKTLIKFCQNNNIQVQAYSPFAVMNKQLIEASTLKEISKKYGKSVTQIILKWDLQQGIIPIPKSGNPNRLKENIDIRDFYLSDDEINKINLLNENKAGIIESLYCPGY